MGEFQQNRCRFNYAYVPETPIYNDSNIMINNGNFNNLNIELQKTFFVNNIPITTVNNTDINMQLSQLGSERFKQYRPYIYPCVPQSIIDFQRSTMNSGLPHSFFTMADCKGIQYFTT